MSTTVIVTGELARDPERCETIKGKKYVLATLRDTIDGGVVWWKVLAFGEREGDTLMGLAAGNTCRVEGRFSVDSYKGEQRFKVFASEIEPLKARAKFDFRAGSN